MSQANIVTKTLEYEDVMQPYAEDSSVTIQISLRYHPGCVSCSCMTLSREQSIMVRAASEGVCGRIQDILRLLYVTFSRGRCPYEF